jgi:ferredoxin
MADLDRCLRQFDPPAWRRALDVLIADVHPIDRDATRIWFAFYPLEVALLLEAASDPAATARKLGLMGRWRLADQIDTSHRFLYGHRYWPQVKSAIQSAAGWPETLPAIVTAVPEAASRTARVDRDKLLGISFVGLMTARQAGAAAFAAAPGKVHLADPVRARTPHQVLTRRLKDDWQGPLGFLRGLKKRWTVTFDENDPAASFPAIEGQEIATAAQADAREYRAADPRCTPGEGPIPVECRAASCGTCWVGVLAGADRLSSMVERDERRPLRVFGYGEPTGATPIVRLACQARVHGAVSIVIPPWNGVFGRYLRSEAAPADRT